MNNNHLIALERLHDYVDLSERDNAFLAVLQKHYASLLDDIAQLKKQLNIITAEGIWLDNYGSLLEFKRPSYLKHTRNDDEAGRKTKDDTYRSLLLLHSSYIYNDLTYSLFRSLGAILEANNWLLIFVFSDKVQYSFINITNDEMSEIILKSRILHRYKLGKEFITVTYGQETSFILNVSWGKLSKVHYHGMGD